MSEVGALIISLQAETAQFRTDMGKVKSDLADLKGGSEDMGNSMDVSTTKARGGMMLLESELGVHLPRALNTLIAGIPGIGAAFSVMLPLIGVVAAIEIIGKLIQKHKEMKEEAEKMQQSQVSFGTTAAGVFTSLDDKLLQVGIRADDVAGNHLAALNKQLELLDHQSLKELMQEFDVLAKAADAAFATMKASWYEIGSGSVGAKHALDEFKVKYDSLITQGKSADAGNLLSGTLSTAKQVLELQEKAASKALDGTDTVGIEQTRIDLQKRGIGYGEKEIAAQHQLIDVLNDQVTVVQKIEALKKAETKSDTHVAENKSLGENAALQKLAAAGSDAHAAAVRRLAVTEAEAVEAGSKGVADPDKQRDAAIAAAGAEFDAAVKAADDILANKKRVYEADVKAAGANGAKMKELAQQFANEQQAHDDNILQAATDSYKKGVTAVATSEKEKVRISEEATRQIVESSSKAGQQTLRFATETAKDEEEVAKAVFAQRAEGISSSLQHEVITQRQATAQRIQLIQSELAAKTASLVKEADAKRKALQDEISAESAAASSTLKDNGGNKADPTYLKYLGDVEQKKREIVALDAKLTSDTKTASIQSVTAINQQKSALTGLQTTMKQVQGQFNQDFAKMAVEGKNFGQSMRQLTAQLLEQWIAYEMKSLEQSMMASIRKTTIQSTQKATDVTTTAAAEAAKASIETAANAKSRLSDAKKGAIKAYNAFADIPIVGPELGAVAAAATFGFLMAFANGGTVPGSGSTDSVPAMLMPGETVVSKALTQQVRDNVGGGSSKGDTHNHLTYAPHVSAIDADGVESMLKKHATTFQKHVNATLRKQNKRAS